MKFLALKDALEKAGLVRLPTQRTERVLPQPSCYPFNPKGRVVSGEVIWKPIDKTAAMVIAKAPWWAHPPTDYGKPINNSPRPVSQPIQNNQPHHQKPKKMVTPKKPGKTAKGGVGKAQKPAVQTSQENHPPVPSHQKALEMLLNDEMSAEDIINIYG